MSNAVLASRNILFDLILLRFYKVFTSLGYHLDGCWLVALMLVAFLKIRNLVVFKSQIYICLPNFLLSDAYLWICLEMFIVARAPLKYLKEECTRSLINRIWKQRWGAVYHRRGMTGHSITEGIWICTRQCDNFFIYCHCHPVHKEKVLKSMKSLAVH